MLKKYRPITPGTRQLILPMHETLTRANKETRARVKPTKSLLLPKRRTNGRNNNGHITCRHKGGGHKRMYRIIDFKRDKENIPARVASIEYDPNRTAFIALLNYADGEKRYIIAPNGLQVGAVVSSGDNVAPELGNALQLKSMPLGTVIHNIELQPGQGGKMVRSAGASAQLANKEEKYAIL